MQRDDPYADWTLLRIEESIDAAKAFIHEKNTATAKALNALGSMKIELARTEEPVPWWTWPSARRMVSWGLIC